MSTTKATFKITKLYGRYSWALSHSNGTVLATSGTDYSRASDARRAIRRVLSVIKAARLVA